MSACEVLTKPSKGRTRKAKKEPVLVLRSGLTQDSSEEPPAYEKLVFPVLPGTGSLPNGHCVKNRPNGTLTTVTALVHNDSIDDLPEKLKPEVDKPFDKSQENIPNGHVPREKVEKNVREREYDIDLTVAKGQTIVPNGHVLQQNAEELYSENEAIDIHGSRTTQKDTDVNDNYLKQEHQTDEEILLEISELEFELRDYVLTEQAKGLQTKTSSYRRPDYAAQIYGATENPTDLVHDPRMMCLKADHEGSLSGIDFSEAEHEQSYEADDELFYPDALQCNPMEQIVVEPDTIVNGDDMLDSEGSRVSSRPPVQNAISTRVSFLENLAEILLGNEEPDEKDSSEDDIVAFLADAPDKVKCMIAHYLKLRKLSCVLVSTSNFHYALHSSASLELPQLTSHCYEFLDENPQFDQRSLVNNCEKCQSLVATRNQETVRTKEATQSRLSSPHFCIAFSRVEPQRTHIEVIDINAGHEIYSRDSRRSFLCDRGFACCSAHYRDCPYVFVSGGRHKHSRQMWRYDVIVSEWKKVASMIHGRSYHSMVSYNDCAIYVIGGDDVACIEEYSLETKRWSECARLVSPVESPACAVFEKKIYIFGGSESVGRVQCFTPRANKMETLHPLPCPIIDGHAVVFRDKIFVFSGQGQVASFEPVTGLSYICASQPIIRSKFCLFVNKDKVYITGGRLEAESPDEESEYNYRYNLSTNAWTRTRKLPKKLAVRTFCDVHIQRRCPVVPFDKMKI